MKKTLHAEWVSHSFSSLEWIQLLFLRFSICIVSHSFSSLEWIQLD